jgi:hypothetical protein
VSLRGPRGGRCRSGERVRSNGRDKGEAETHALVDGLGVGTEGGVGDRRGLGVAGDFLRRLKRGILRLALDVASDGEGTECWRPRKRSESSDVLVRSLAEAVGVREGVAI